MKIIKRQEGRADLASEFTGVGVEIGVERANYTVVIAKYCEHVYGIDPWEHSEEYRAHVGQNQLDSFFEIAKNKTKDLNCTLIRDYSATAAGRFEDGELQFVYVDGAHDFYNVSLDLMTWWPKLASGGVMAGHDFTGQHKEVKQAVLAFCEREGIDTLTEWRGDNSHSFSFKKM